MGLSPAWDFMEKERSEMDKFDYQLFVIGGGSGGVRAARIAAGLG